MRNTEGKDVIKATRRKGRATLKAERKMKMREEKLQVWRNFKKSSGNKGLKGCDAILGMTWLAKYNPATNWKNGTVSFYHDGKTHRLDTQSNPSTPSLPSLAIIHTTKTTIQLCSIQHIKRIIRHNEAVLYPPPLTPMPIPLLPHLQTQKPNLYFLNSLMFFLLNFPITFRLVEMLIIALN